MVVVVKSFDKIQHPSIYSQQNRNKGNILDLIKSTYKKNPAGFIIFKVNYLIFSPALGMK